MSNNSEILLKLHTLIEEGKYEEARDVITEYFKQPLSSEEKGQAYLDVADMYLEIANYFNRQRLELMEKSAKALEDLDKQRRKLDDAVNLEEIRNKIKES